MNKFIKVFTLIIMSAFKVAFAGGDDASPLATWDLSKNTSFLAAATGAGTLKITDTCVWLEVEGATEATLLVWPEPTSLNAETGEITFVNYKGDTMILKDGDIITAGGASPTGNSTFVKAPNPACNANINNLFMVNDVLRGQ